MNFATLNVGGKLQKVTLKFTPEHQSEAELQAKAEAFLAGLQVDKLLKRIAHKVSQWVPEVEGGLDEKALCTEMVFKQLHFDEECVTAFISLPSTFPDAAVICVLTYALAPEIKDFGMYAMNLDELAKRYALKQAVNARDLTQLQQFAQAYNTLPPPWVILPHAHPTSIGWRMGYGEGFIDLWGEWWDAQNWNEAQQVGYFREWKPPHAWLQWVLFTLWPEVEEDYFDALEDSEDEANETLRPYFERLEGLGFGSFEDWKADFEREGWQ